MFRTETPRHTCIACGHERHDANMRPYGQRRDGTVQTWACQQCLDTAPAHAEHPEVHLTAAVLEVLA